MIGIVLAGGFAKRLGDLGKRVAKPLLPIAGKPVVEHISRRILELGIDRVIVSTNLKFLPQFEEWLKESGLRGIELRAEASRREEEKPGAVGALASLTEGLREDCVIVAGDNYFTSSLKGMKRFFERKGGPVIGIYNIGNEELVRQYAWVRVDGHHRVLELVEKPQEPKGSLIATCIYMLPWRSLRRLQEYLRLGLGKDAPGHFMAWLAGVEVLYAYKLRGRWWDIGTLQTYEEARRITEGARARGV